MSSGVSSGVSSGGSPERAHDRSTAGAEVASPSVGLICADLNLHYGRQPALVRLNLTAAPGTAVGLVGRNGAGKTTLFKAILGLEPLTSGQVELDPPTRSRAEFLSRVGYVPDHLSAHDWMTAGGVIDFVRSQRRGIDAAWCAGLVGRLNIPLDRNVRALSRGQQARLAFLLGVMHRPSLLLLDEPLLGADPASHREILSTLAALRDETECTIIMASHALTDLARITDRTVIIDGGEIHDDLATDELAATTKRVAIRPAPEAFDAPVETVHQMRTEDALVLTVGRWTDLIMESIVRQCPDARIDVVDLNYRDACADRLLGLEARQFASLAPSRPMRRRARRAEGSER